ncbi:ATP-binding protein [Croceitalea marina]|uniref:histidine kinase n=1 Tax=Croceitalea marina TaxID=1775166 RepID=A0ABW5MTV7_9FLAO
MNLSISESNDHLKSVFFEKAYSPLVILNSELVFVDVNNAAETVSGLNRKQFIGKSLLDMFPYLKGTKRLESYKNVLKTGKPLGFDSVSFFTKDGIEHKFMIRAFKIGDFMGISTLDVTTLTDIIGELKNAKTSLQNANEHLKVQNQELEDFSYVVAHDLKAPLSNLKSLIKIVLSTNDISDELYPMVDRIGKVAEVMCSKIRGINDVMAVKSSFGEKHQKILFAEIIENIKLTHSEEIINSRTIIKEDFSKCPFIEYNPSHIDSILLNLMSNALKYRHPNRKLNIKISTKVIKGRTHLFFKDNGIGFDENLATNKIFGLFKRMHTHVDGLGVGLYIIYTIIKKNGGNIKVKSKINIGTEFTIQF